MGYSKLTNTHQSSENHHDVSGSSVRTLRAVPVLQRVEPEEERQMKRVAVQKTEVEEEEPLQGKFVAQRQTLEEEEIPVQGKFNAQLQALEEDESPMQGKFIIQKAEMEEEMPLQGKFAPIQRRAMAEARYNEMQAMHGGGNLHGRRRNVPQERLERQREQSIQEIERRLLQNPANGLLPPVQLKTENNTGLPDNLKAGVENLSGFSMDDVKVHYNSDKPAQLNALAYAQGTDIHVASGQEQHLPHEAWHVAQQKQGRVQPTMQLIEGVAVNTKSNFID